MRRVFQSSAQKARSIRRARDELRRRKRPKRPRRVDVARPVRPVKGRQRDFKALAAPARFSLVENPDETLRYFRKAHEWLVHRRRVRFDLSSVSQVTPDAIALLVACVNSRRYTQGVPVAGNEPDDPVARTMFDQSGFYDHVQIYDQRPRDRRQLLVHRITNNRVENEEAKRAGRIAVAHLFGDGRRIRPLYEVLIECMANTNNHANTSRRGVYDWWLFVYNDPSKRRSIFVFLDLGVGIFKSLPVQRFWKDPFRSVGLRGNLSIVEKLLAGEISSRTGKRERGKGIPKINEHACGGTFSQFFMISNDVFADLCAQRFRYLKEPFDGTLYAFEISNPGP